MRPTFWHTFIAVVALVLPLSAACAGSTSARVIRLKPVFGGQLTFSANVGGQPRLFLLDTGGGATVIAPSLATRIGCKPWGQVTGFGMRGQRLDLKRCDDFRIEAAGLTLTAPTAGVYDILKGAPKDTPAIVGSVGLDMFVGRVVTLDIGHGTLTIETPASLKSRLKSARLLTSRFERDAQGLALEPLVAIETPQGRVWLEIDSGSDGAVIVNRPIAAVLAADPNRSGAQQLRLRLAGGPEIRTSGHVEDLIRDGNIGVHVLRHWIVTSDAERRRVWIAPSGL